MNKILISSILVVILLSTSLTVSFADKLKHDNAYFEYTYSNSNSPLDQCGDCPQKIHITAESSFMLYYQEDGTFVRNPTESPDPASGKYEYTHTAKHSSKNYNYEYTDKAVGSLDYVMATPHFFSYQDLMLNEVPINPMDALNTKSVEITVSSNEVIQRICSEMINGKTYDCSFQDKPSITCIFKDIDPTLGGTYVGEGRLGYLGYRPDEVYAKTQTVSCKLTLEPFTTKIRIDVSPATLDPTKPTTSKITVTVKDEKNKPLKEYPVEIKICTEFGTKKTDGHFHDSIRKDPCKKGDRPTGKIDGNIINPENPITKKTDTNGKIVLTYASPKSSIGIGISGKDKIIATSKLDSNIKDESFITTKVVELKPMIGSVPLSTSDCGSGVNYFFEKQGKHDCLFYGTKSTNDAIVRIADKFAKAQNVCKSMPSGSCTIKDEKGNDKKIIITGNPTKIKLTAMSLPWGGLSDIDGTWTNPHKSHNTGKEVDIGFGNLKKGAGYDSDRIYLLRYVITQDSNYNKFASGEGDDIKNTLKSNTPHIHIYFKN